MEPKVGGGVGGGGWEDSEATSVTVETLVEGPGEPAGEKVGVPWAESLLGEASG